MRITLTTTRRSRWTLVLRTRCAGWTGRWRGWGGSFPLRALIVSTEFTVSASQAVKARMVAEQYGGGLTLRQYRYELGKGIDWTRGRAAA